MKTKSKNKIKWGLPLGVAIPGLLILLFEQLKTRQTAMDFWVNSILAPAAQCMGRFWAVLPVSGMEIWIVFLIVWGVAWILRALVLLFRDREVRGLVRRAAVLVAVGLWIWCGVCWLWNVTYHAASFREKSGLAVGTYSVEELKQVTAYFAKRAGELSGQVARDEEGHFLRDTKGQLEQGLEIYEEIEKEFPFLQMEPVKAKPIFFSRLQSMMGFTGMYFPFTGEANVNVDAPAALFPATVAHEMAHQRMVALELEANFVGVAACLSSDHVAYQYSGAICALIHLCNALYPVDKEGWYEISGQYFTPELAVDWNDNNTYWRALDSKVEEAAEQVYDSFLKGNGQELGMRSYGACVDLLVAYYGEEAKEYAG